jgi:hypothetical protein
MTNLLDQDLKRLISLLLLFYALCYTGLAAADDDKKERDDDIVTLTIKKAQQDGNKLLGKAVLSEKVGKHVFKLYDTSNNKNLLLKRKKTKSKKFEFEIEFADKQVPCQIKVTVDKPKLEATAKVSDCNDETVPAPGPTPLPTPISGNYTILAANDLGMHCADLDYQIFSILPPFNVVHAQLVEKETANTLPKLLSDNGIEAVYTAATDAKGSINSTGIDDNGNLKTNFWS